MWVISVRISETCLEPVAMREDKDETLTLAREYAKAFSFQFTEQAERDSISFYKDDDPSDDSPVVTVTKLNPNHPWYNKDTILNHARKYFRKEF